MSVRKSLRGTLRFVNNRSQESTNPSFTYHEFDGQLIRVDFLSKSIVMKVTIRSWHAVATWRWDMPEDDVCGICRVQFDGTCPTCKYPGDHCTLCMFTSGVAPADLSQAKAGCLEATEDKAN